MEMMSRTQNVIMLVLKRQMVQKTGAENGVVVIGANSVSKYSTAQKLCVKIIDENKIS